MAATESELTGVERGWLLENVADVVSVVGDDGIYRFVSASSRQVLGWEPVDLVGHTEESFTHPDDVATLHASRAGLAVGDTASTVTRLVRPDGSYGWTESSTRKASLNGDVVLVSTTQDITARHEATSSLRHQALTDPLTGVANRTVLMDRLQQALRRLDRSGGVVAVLYGDLDRFKVLNDSLGHRAGDSVLLQIAERLSHHLRPSDTLARLGGDEFVIVADGVADEHAAIELGRRVIDAAHKAFKIGDEEFECTLSLGIACTADSQRSADDLLQEADLALYKAKDRGRDRAEVFDEELRTKAVGRLATERLLRRALLDRQLVVEYQPIIELRTDRIVGAEALVRIRHPEQGLLHPAAFLEVAEETGLLIGMDEQVLADAVRQASGWRAAPPTSHLEVAINVTARHLADTGFPTAVLDQLEAHHVPPNHLQIEVTERVLMEASNSAMTGLRALRAAGVQVGLDDFGTGYSSLAYLRQFPLDFVKIDQAFVHDLAVGSGDVAILAAIIDLAHALGLVVTAEGVETAAERDMLESLGCDRAQGFLFGSSSTPEAISTYVAFADR